MKSSSSRRIPPWPGPGERPHSSPERGAVSLVVVFLLFVFSGLGLSMIYLSQVYLKLNAYRKFSFFLDYASENGIKRGLADVREWLQSRARLASATAADIAAMRASPKTAFPILVENALGGGFPRSLQESDEGLSWESLSTCGFESAMDCGSYLRIEAGLRIESNGAMTALRPRRVSSLVGSLGIVAGYLPLAAVPLLINKDMSEAERARFLKDNAVSLVAKKGEVFPPQAAATGQNVIPRDANPIISKALDTQIFTPQDLSNSRLRQILALPAGDDPVPDGVYLIKTDLGLGGIYVQGDVGEMITAINGDAQVIVFRMAAGEWRLEFSPAGSWTKFAGPAGVSEYAVVPLGIIIVSGMINSLGGGAVNLDGSVEMVRDREIPSVLSGVSLTIVSSDEVKLSSHLILQGVKWQNGVPYIKESQSQVVIFTPGRDFQTGEDRAGGIVIDAGAPADLKVQASLTAGKGGVTIEGSGKAVELMGSLHTDEYAGNGNALKIVSDDRIAAGRFPTDSPLTATPQLSVYSLKVLSWQEY